MSTVWNTQPSTAGVNIPLLSLDHVKYIDAYSASLANAVTAIGSTVTTLVIDDSVSVTSNVTVPSTLTLWFMGQGKFTVSAAVTCTINGPIVAAPRQIFAGSGTATGLDGCLSVSPYWWGTVSSDILNLYVATTGSDSNDGMTVSTPLLTVQAAGNKIYTFSYADITYKINLAAGTYTESASFTKAFPTPNRVQFLGPAVANGATPTAIMDSPGGAGQTGLYFQNQVRAYVEDIKFTDYADTGTPGASGNSTGITAATGCELYTKNVHVTNCDSGIEAAEESRLRVEAGIISANATGVRCISHVTYTLGYNGSAADINGATGPAILSNTVSGLLAQEGTMGHADYCYFGSNAVGAEVVASSRIHTANSSYISNTTGIRLRANSNLFESGSNTYTTNTDNVIIKSGSLRITEEQDSFNPGFLTSDTTSTTTQSATPVTIYTKSFAANELAVRGAGFRLKLHGDVVGTAGTKNVTVTLGATTLLNRTITASTTDYYIEVDCLTRTAANLQKYTAKVFENGVAPVIAVASATEDLTAAKDLVVTHNVANTADRNDIELVELEVIH